MMAVLYEIEKSGYADKLRSGIVITGGSSKTANLGNFIYDTSGYKVRTGYPRKLFSCLDCDGIAEPSSATSVGLILNALSDQTVNCAIEAAPFSRIVTEIETASGTEFEVEVGVGNPGTEENPQGTIWKDNEIEKVPVDKKKGKKNGDSGKAGWVKVTITKIKEAGEKVGDKLKEGLLELYQDIAEDEPNE